MAMTTGKSFDYRQALDDPCRIFGQPGNVLTHPDLDARQKQEILESWRQDAVRLSESEGENMGSGSEPMLKRVNDALLELERQTGTSAPRTSGPSPPEAASWPAAQPRDTAPGTARASLDASVWEAGMRYSRVAVFDRSGCLVIESSGAWPTTAPRLESACHLPGSKIGAKLGDMRYNGLPLGASAGTHPRAAT
jgi:hypothetical protein